MARGGYHGNGSHDPQRLNIRDDVPAPRQRRGSWNVLGKILTTAKWAAITLLGTIGVVSCTQVEYERSQRGEDRDLSQVASTFGRIWDNSGSVINAFANGYNNYIGAPGLRRLNMARPGQISSQVIVCTSKELVDTVKDGIAQEKANGPEWLKTPEGLNYLKQQAWAEAANARVNHDAAQLGYRGHPFYSRKDSNDLPFVAVFTIHSRPFGWNPNLPLPQDGYVPFGNVKPYDRLVEQKDIDDPVACPAHYTWKKTNIPGLKND